MLASSAGTLPVLRGRSKTKSNMLRGSAMRVITDIYRGAEHLLRSQAVHAQILQARVLQGRVSQVLHRLCTAPKRRVTALLALAAMASPLLAEQALAAGPGDGEIRIGNTMPYSGPAAAYGIIGKVISAYFDKINAEGGINGRRIRFISYDDAYNPAKTLDMTRKLVEEDKVLLTFACLGTDPMAAVQPYLNANKVPQLLSDACRTAWDNPA